ncbi:MAG: putative bifunctional diguanylate cyclase/phosphodiesterase [Porcipelethomonas sp.]
MSLDIREYSEAFDEFLLKMEKIPDHIHPGIQDALEKIGEMLRISRVDVSLYDNPMMAEKKIGRRATVFRNGECDESRSSSLREETGNGNVALYDIYQIAGDEDWTDEEKKKILIVAKMLFVYNGRSRVMKIAEHLTFHDKDMGIFNLQYFMKFCGMKIAHGQIGRYTVCYFNLKGFSAVNEQIGRDSATKVMHEYISMLESMFSDEEIVCRIGGDNFISIFYDEKMEKVMEHMKGVEITYDHDNNEKILITSTAGYYSVPPECKMPTEVMDRASLVFNIAKNIRKESFVIYSDELAESVKQRKAIENMFPEALKNEEFQVFYQPKVNLKDYTLAGAEALCRWFHNGEMVLPYKFIPVYEQTKAITILDFYMLEHVCMDIRRWLDEGRKIVKISVNLSRRHLGDANLLEHILEIVDKYNVPHEYIEIELTETTTDVSFKDLRRIVAGLQEAGVSTSVDDFGMGYSSLNLIRELPWDVLKIDKSFLENDEGGRHGRIMLKHIISMAQEIGLECIAEGVENSEHVRILKENNCWIVQGYYFDKPLPRPEFERRLDELGAV